MPGASGGRVLFLSVLSAWIFAVGQLRLRGDGPGFKRKVFNGLSSTIGSDGVPDRFGFKQIVSTIGSPNRAPKC